MSIPGPAKLSRLAVTATLLLTAWPRETSAQINRLPPVGRNPAAASAVRPVQFAEPIKAAVPARFMQANEELPAGSGQPGDAATDSLAVSPTILGVDVSPINLESALRLGGVENPQIRLAALRVPEAVAQRQYAAAQILPSINVGTNYDTHTGTLQQSSGNILKVNRNALYAGLGANAIAAGTVNIPGIMWDGNTADVLFNFLKSRQRVLEKQAASFATSNQMLLEVATAYFELLRAEQGRAIASQIRDEAREVARLTANYAATGQGRDADANRAATEFRQRDVEVLAYEAQILKSSARLAQLLNLDPSIRLKPTDPWAVPMFIVSDNLTLPELITIGLTQRPEMAERQAAVRYAMFNLRNNQLLPFSPNYLVGFSAGTFGGGSNLSQPPYNVSPFFGNFSARSDFDVVAYWTLKNLAVGNRALINRATAEYRISDLELLKTLNLVRSQIASAKAKTTARFAQIGINERAVKTGQQGFSEDLLRTKAAEGLPIEVLNNLDLLARSRFEYLASIIEYNRAEFELYVALGQPPATALTQPGVFEGRAGMAEPIASPPAAETQPPAVPAPLPGADKSR